MVWCDVNLILHLQSRGCHYKSKIKSNHLPYGQYSRSYEQVTLLMEISRKEKSIFHNFVEATTDDNNNYCLKWPPLSLGQVLALLKGSANCCAKCAFLKGSHVFLAGTLHP